MNFFGKEKKRKKEFQKKLVAILPLYNKELSFLNEKYGVILDPYLLFNEKGVIPQVRIVLKESIVAPPAPPVKVIKQEEAERK